MLVYTECFHKTFNSNQANISPLQERRKALEAERQARLLEMQEKRKQRESEFEQRQLEREKERIEAARTKECEREERIAALNAQQVAHIQELQRKIQQKVIALCALQCSKIKSINAVCQFTQIEFIQCFCLNYFTLQIGLMISVESKQLSSNLIWFQNSYKCLFIFSNY